MMYNNQLSLLPPERYCSKEAKKPQKVIIKSLNEQKISEFRKKVQVEQSESKLYSRQLLTVG